MFTFRHNIKGVIKPIAKVIGGELNGKVLYIGKKDVTDDFDGDKIFDNIELSDGKFEWIPETRDHFNDVILTSATKGSGKSTMCAELAMRMKQIFKLNDDDVILVKKNKMEDPAYAKLNPAVVCIDEEFLENPLTCDEISPDHTTKVVILDDLDTIQSKKLETAYLKFQNDLLECGRKYNIYVLIAMHKLCAGQKTKAILSEADYFLIFPEGVTTDFRYCLQRYGDMSLDVIRDLKKTPSKWILFHQHSPKFILTETMARVFDLDREDDISKEKKKSRLLKRHVIN
jgi:hypothetical protein